MSLYRSISVDFWSDSKVYDNFTVMERYLYLYILTNSHTNICGCYEISQRKMAEETGIELNVLAETMQRLEHVHHVIRYSQDAKELLILNWGKYNWTKSDKVKTAVQSVSKYIKTDDYRSYVLAAISGRRKKERSKERTDTDSDTDSDSDSDTDSDSDSDTESDSDSDSESDVSIGYGYPIDRVSEKDSDRASGGESEKCQNDDFERFWAVYPRQIRMRDARKAFKDVAVPVEILIQSVEAWKQSEDWTKDNGRWIPAPSKWLNEHRWEDVRNQNAEPFTPGDAEIAAIANLRRWRDQAKQA